MVTVPVSAGHEDAAVLERRHKWSEPRQDILRLEVLSRIVHGSQPEVEIHVTARNGSEEEAAAAVDEVADKLAVALGPAVFSTDGRVMEEIVAAMLTDRGETLSAAESCTGGLIGQRLTELAGSSKYFMEGVISYSNDAKVRTLNVPQETLDKHGAVSSQTAEAMASGMRERADTDYAISVTGVAGPGGGSEEKPVGTVFIGFADRTGTRSVKFVFPGDRSLIRWRSSQAALDYLRRQMLKRG